MWIGLLGGRCENVEEGSFEKSILERYCRIYASS